MKPYVKYAVTGLGMLVLICGCAAYDKTLRSESVRSIPNKKYEKIIRLDTPDSMPLKPDAGFVYVEPEGKVTTDFAREIFVKNLDNLDKYEQLNRRNMGKFIIRDKKGKVHGYYEILPEYRTTLWERGDGILLQVIIPRGMPGSNDDGGIHGMMPRGGR